MSTYESYKSKAFNILQNFLKVEGPFTAQQLAGGLSGSMLIKITTPSGSYVARFWNMQWKDYFAQDFACQLIASDEGYGPRIFFTDEAAGLTIMEYCHPQALSDVSIQLQSLVDFVKKIHTGPAMPCGINKSRYLDELIAESIPIAPQFPHFELLKTAKEAAFVAMSHKARCVTCHRDLHPGNLIYTAGHFLAIDYTWGSMDDPYADLSTLAMFNCVTPMQERLLLQLYLGQEPSREDIARLSLMQLPTKMFYGLEFLIRASYIDWDIETQLISPKSYTKFGCHGSGHPSPENLLKYAVSSLQEAVDYSRSEEYIQDLACLQKQK